MTTHQKTPEQKLGVMPPRQETVQAGRHWAASATALIGLGIFIKLAYDVHTGHMPAYDAATTAYFEKYQNPWIYKLALFFSWLGGTVLIIALTGLTTVYFIRKGRFKPDGAVMLFATIGGLGLMTLLKHVFFRPRDYHIYDHLGSSFPSGHVLFALTVYGLLVHWSTRESSPVLRAVLWCVVGFICLLVGFGRVYVGAHYITDVIAGLAIAAPWLFINISLLTKFQRPPPN